MNFVHSNQITNTQTKNIERISITLQTLFKAFHVSPPFILIITLEVGIIINPRFTDTEGQRGELTCQSEVAINSGTGLQSQVCLTLSPMI